MKIQITDYEEKELEDLNNLVGYKFTEYIEDVIKLSLNKLKINKDSWIKSVKDYKNTTEYKNFLNIKVESIKTTNYKQKRLTDIEIEDRIKLLPDTPL